MLQGRGLRKNRGGLNRICCFSLLGMQRDNEESSPQRVCSMAGDETGWLDPEEHKEMGRSTDNLPALSAWAVYRLAGSACWS